MEQLQARDTLVIRQQKEMLEIFTGFETRNRYKIMGSDGQELYFAAEVAGSWFMRNFLQAFRPFTMEVMGADNQRVLRLQRPFTFFLHKVEVFDGHDVQIGYVQMKFSLIRRIYKVYDATGNQILEMVGPILKPWTLIIMRDGVEIGRLVKRWSGLLKEVVSDADNFTLNFPLEMDIKHKAVLLGAVFLIDFVQFEDKGKR